MDNTARQIMTCPHCGDEMLKTAIQCEDLSGWLVGWLCECDKDDERIELTIHAGMDWMASILLNQEKER